MCYEKGNGVTKDEAKAAKLYKAAADQGCAAAQCNLGEHCFCCYTVLQSYVLLIACMNINAGICLEYGTGVAINEAEAVKLYKLAAEQGYADAQCYLGNSFFLLVIFFS